ncbi:MAG: rhomboid family intramembrane serine protease [Woeseiaceae bacterium]
MSKAFTRQPAGRGGIPNVIFALLVANGLIFALQQMAFEFMMVNFALWPATHPQAPFAPWQLLTYGFLHGNLTHIAFNMFGLWMFGQDLERLWGPKKFLGLLLAYGLTFPNRIVVPLFPPIPMRAITFVVVFGALELFLGVSGRAPGIANFAHLGGMLFGFLTLRYWSKRRRP